MNLKTVVVIGTGTMGQGIAQWFLQQKLHVEMVDANYEFSLKSKKNIESNLDVLVTKGKLTKDEAHVMKNSLKVANLSEISTKSDLVVEAIIEDKKIKAELFSALESIVDPDTIIASNTSSFPITELAQSLSTPKSRERFLGLHFFNPATIMKLVEVINGNYTKISYSQNLVEWFNSKGKVACLCNDSPGFIVNRVARNFYGESLRACITYDLARIAEIDTVMKSVGGFKMGPFELMDMIGIDINLSVTESVYKAFFDEARFKPHRLQQEMVASGRLGRKTKIGFYQYES